MSFLSTKSFHVGSKANIAKVQAAEASKRNEDEKRQQVERGRMAEKEMEAAKAVMNEVSKYRTAKYSSTDHDLLSVYKLIFRRRAFEFPVRAKYI